MAISVSAVVQESPGNARAQPPQIESAGASIARDPRNLSRWIAGRRIGEIADSGLYAKRIGTARRICVASPDYLKKHGTPKTSGDLRSHSCILYTLLATGATWPFEGMPVKIAGRVRGNSPEVVATMATRGHGIAMAPDFIFGDALAAGQLRKILKSGSVPSLPIHALYLARQYVPMRIRLFVDYAAQTFARDEQLRI